MGCPVRVAVVTRREHRWLVELTGLPTASGLEDQPIRWIDRWASRRKNVRLRRDAVGNLVLEPASRTRRAKVWMTAHLDHPAFVAGHQDGRRLEFEFRGGVRTEYFDKARVDFGNVRGTVVEYDAGSGVVQLDRGQPVAERSIGRWVLSSRQLGIKGDMLHAHACDDLAGAAAALAAFDELRTKMPNVGVLLTRGEEMGFLGAIGACRSGTIPDGTRLICLETSRSFDDSPIGAGPVVRVGDASSVFDPDLTDRFSRTAARKLSVPWQRKLMAGGSCEATAFGAYGHQSTCLCLPLGNYHNMGHLDGVERGTLPARAAPEVISLSDFDGLVKLLVTALPELESEPRDLTARLDEIYEEGRSVL